MSTVEHDLTTFPEATVKLTDRLRIWVKLTEEKRELEKLVRDKDEQLKGMEEALLEEMALAGMSKATVDGMTCYTQREFTCGIKPDVDKKVALKAFLDQDHAELVLLGWQSLRAMVKECGETGQPLPECVQQFCETGERFRLRARKG